MYLQVSVHSVHIQVSVHSVQCVLDCMVVLLSIFAQMHDASLPTHTQAHPSCGGIKGGGSHETQCATTWVLSSIASCPCDAITAVAHVRRIAVMVLVFT